MLSVPRVPAIRFVVIPAAAQLVDAALFSNVVPDAASGSWKDAPLVGAFAVSGFTLLCWRGRFPLTVLALTAANSVAGALMLDYRPVLSVCMAIANVVNALAPIVSLPACAAAAAATITAWLVSENGAKPAEASIEKTVSISAGYLFILIVAAGVGYGRRINRQRLENLDRRRREEARAAAMEERLRMARDLHDVVSSAVTTMTIHSAAASRIVRSDPDRAMRSLAEIEKAGSRAMSELRHLLEALRSPDLEAPRDGSGLADLPALIDSFREVGTTVNLVIDGSPEAPEPRVEQVAYRIVREALGNSSRHAGSGATVQVSISWTADALDVRVADQGGQGRASIHLSAGHGLIGLDEQVRLLGGSFSAGEHAGGFLVTAVLPLKRRGAEPMPEVVG